MSDDLSDEQMEEIRQVVQRMSSEQPLPTGEAIPVERYTNRENLEKRTDYVAVLRRAIPVSDCSMDTSTHIIREGETVRDVMDWAERLCAGSAVMISVEIVKSN